METPLLEEETANKVLRQVEFYFSDSNLPRDKFLNKTIGESSDGMVSLALICSFSRMRSHLNLGDVKADEVSQDTLQSVAETLRRSTSIKVSEDGKKIGRISELSKSEDLVEQLDVRTVAASPFEYDVKLEDVEIFFSKFAKVNSVRLPRVITDKRFFCGTALVEFSTEEEAKDILNKSLIYAGVELELQTKKVKDFDEEREIESEKLSNSGFSLNSTHKYKLSPDSSYPKGLIVSFTLKSTAAGDSIEKNGSQKLAIDGSTLCESGKDSPENNSEKSELASTNAKDEKLVIDGSTLCESEKDSPKNNSEKSELASTYAKDEGNPEENTKFDKKNGLDSQGKETCDGEQPLEGRSDEGEEVEGKHTAAIYRDNMNVVLREDLKSVFQKFGTVKYVDFKIGEDSGYIRFDDPEAAQKSRAASVLAEQGGLVVKNYIAILEPVTGEAEKEYWSLLRGSQDRHRDNKGNRGRGGKSNRSGNGKHARNRESESNSGRPNKMHKVGAA